jgi:hypothetical protein
VRVAVLHSGTNSGERSNSECRVGFGAPGLAGGGRGFARGDKESPRTIRRTRNKTQQQIADKMGVTRSTHGKRGVRQPRTVGLAKRDGVHRLLNERPVAA